MQLQDRAVYCRGQHTRATAQHPHVLLAVWICDVITTSWPSVLWRCWLGGRKGIRPVKTEWWGAGVVMSAARCRLVYGPADATHCLLLQIAFTFLVPAYSGSPRQRVVKWVCVCDTVVMINIIFTCAYFHPVDRFPWCYNIAVLFETDMRKQTSSASVMSDGILQMCRNFCTTGRQCLSNIAWHVCPPLQCQFCSRT